jgi:NAD(P)-dependent dehydrogenase (short-subunit alcohol dehydrogenase family)
MDLGIKGKVALVTGAGQGVGAQICLTLAAEGVKCAVNDLFQDRADETVKQVKAAGGEAIAVIADVTDEKAVQAMVKEVESKLGGVDILVNNAGLVAGGGWDYPTAGGGPTFQDTNKEYWDKVIGLIKDGTLNCTRAVIDGMIQRKWGRVVNIISDAGRYGIQGLSAYSMGKAGVVGFTRALSQDVGEFCVTVNCVSPGYVETPTSKPYGDRMMEGLLMATPIARGMGRVPMPVDIAEMVAFVASERAAFLSGQIISVNGAQATP